MVGWLLFFFLAPQLFVLDGFLAQHLAYRPDLSVALCLVLALFVRTGCLPGLLFLAAIGRSMLVDGHFAVHFLAMGVPIAVLIPLRSLFFRRSFFYQCVAAGVLALTVPKTAAIFGMIGREAVEVVPVTAGSIAIAVVLVPPMAWLLRLLPPMSLFVEKTE